MNMLKDRRFIILRRRVRVERDSQHLAWGRQQTDGCARWLAAIGGGLSDKDICWAVRRYHRTEGRRAIMDGEHAQYRDVFLGTEDV